MKWWNLDILRVTEPKGMKFNKDNQAEFVKRGRIDMDRPLVRATSG